MRVIILGGGISGLSLAWYLRSSREVVVLEREERVGGWLQTEEKEGFLCEKGPRTFRYIPHSPLVELVKELGLEQEIIYSSPLAKKRYILEEGKLRGLFRMRWIASLWKEWGIPYLEDEETIFQCAERRFGLEIAETLFDAMTLGVYAGDMRELSMRACFPKIKEWEREYGSLTKALLSHLSSLKKGRLFSLKGGMGSLMDRLAHHLASSLETNCKIEEIALSKKGVTVITDKQRYSADYLVSALPYASLPAYFPQLTPFLEHAPKMQSLQIVDCGFHKKVDLIPGFGYLVPTREREALLGALFDAHIFPEHNREREQTRITFMVREDADPLATARNALVNHLQIKEPPCFLKVSQAKDAIPQFGLNHFAFVAQLKRAVSEHYPRLLLTGNYLSGVSVADCVEHSQKLAQDSFFSTVP